MVRRIAGALAVCCALYITPMATAYALTPSQLSSVQPTVSLRATHDLVIPNWVPPIPSGASKIRKASVGDSTAGVLGALNHVEVKNPVWVRSFESGGQAKVIQNDVGAFVAEIYRKGQRPLMVGAWDETLADGTRVVGLGFKAVDTATNTSVSSLFGLTSADAANYASFWNCSYAWRQSEGSDIHVHLCTPDANNVQWVGSALAGLAGGMALSFAGPVGAGVGGIIGGAIAFFWISRLENPDGTIDFTVPSPTASATYGWTYWDSMDGGYGDWVYYYSNNDYPCGVWGDGDQSYGYYIDPCNSNDQYTAYSTAATGFQAGYNVANGALNAKLSLYEPFRPGPGGWTGLENPELPRGPKPPRPF